ncbi:S-layer homology domain-containing protein [Bacillus solitudinis]|uniref:S-layer homology domain-containing protein n=1 Tax=Bacillus solitudinis TaxID=2014074 RepID=UPI000C231B21|nr:S-layer homology domain-containing protein [Bacillus solitudinis]
MKRKTKISGITSMALAASLILASQTFAEGTESTIEAPAVEDTVDGGEESEEEAGVPEKAVEAVPSPYQDVSHSHFAYDAIVYLTEQGYVSGTADNRFNPDEAITRAQAAKIIVEALNLKASSSYNLKATDVPSNHWAYNYFRALEKEEIMSGNSGKLSPNADVTRGQMAAMLNRAFNYAPPAIFAPFKDINRSFWAYNDINTLAANGVTTQVGQAFRPNEVTTRAQFSLFIARSLDDRFKEYSF